MQDTIFFNEVVTRDGFQNETQFIATEQKIEIINDLSVCGFTKIEVTSFTSPKAIPMLADAQEVMRGIQRAPGVEYTVLIPNLKGAERALEVAPDELNLVMSTSQSHNVSNMRMSMEDSFKALSQVVQFVDGRVAINVSLSTAFGCPMEGHVPPEAVIRWVDQFVDLGVKRFTICDTTGMANPVQVAKMADFLKSTYPDLRFVFHFHNTRGMGIANVLSAIQHGIRHFDGSLGGLGGCPYAPGATGNICSEDTIYMVQQMGYKTQIQFDRLLTAAHRLQDIVGHTLPGQLVKAGTNDQLHPVSKAVQEILDQIH
jgi:hydroxymethylglutaryl-CoA lyase